MDTPELRKNGLLKGLGRNIIILGLVSFFTDISSEMLYPIIPIFLREVLMAPRFAVGLIEGVAESTASLLKVLSGWVSDRTARRKPFVVFGYSLSSISKPLLALAGIVSGWYIVLIARFLDRVGKGVRTPARDALIVASCDEKNRGKAFGLHRSMDTFGAVIGPLIALLFFWLFSREGGRASDPAPYIYLFMIAFIPAALAVFLLVIFGREKRGAGLKGKAFSFKDRRLISKPFYTFLFIYGIFCIGNSSDIFLILKAKYLGFSLRTVILAYVYYNVVYAIVSTPAGWLSDRIGRTKMLIIGLLVFCGVYVGFAFVGTEYRHLIWVLFAFYGVYTACTEGITKALVADTASQEVQATAMGLFQTMTGVLAFFASLIAGLLWEWDKTHFAAPFFYGAFFSGCAAILFIIYRKKLK